MQRTQIGIEARNYLHRRFEKRRKSEIGGKKQGMELMKLNKQQQTVESRKRLFSISLLIK